MQPTREISVFVDESGSFAPDGVEVGGALTHSEERFFGGIKNLKKLYLKPILRKRWL